MKRYAIVRVDRYPICPLGFKHKCEDFVKTGICDCKHGDTKEQLVRKVAQALEICYNKGYRNITSEEYAKFIVEFLGVEE